MAAKIKHLIMIAYYTPNDGITAKDESFYNNNVDKLHYKFEVSFQIIMYANITIVYIYCFTSFLPRSNIKGT